jgi:hypothetical protein
VSLQSIPPVMIAILLRQIGSADALLKLFNVSLATHSGGKFRAGEFGALNSKWYRRCPWVSWLLIWPLLCCKPIIVPDFRRLESNFNARLPRIYCSLAKEAALHDPFASLAFNKLSAPAKSSPPLKSKPPGPMSGAHRSGPASPTLPQQQIQPSQVNQQPAGNSFQSQGDPIPSYATCLPQIYYEVLQSSFGRGKLTFDPTKKDHSECLFGRSRTSFLARVLRLKYTCTRTTVSVQSHQQVLFLQLLVRTARGGGLPPFLLSLK